MITAITKLIMMVIVMTTPDYSVDNKADVIDGHDDNNTSSFPYLCV